MEVTIKHINGMHFVGQGANPVDIHMDARPGYGGEGLGASPMELLLMAVAGCTGIDVVSILEKMRVKLDRFEMTVEGDRAEEHPKFFTNITVVYKFWGEALDESKLHKAVDLSQEKYCSVSHTVNKAAKISYRIEINP